MGLKVLRRLLAVAMAVMAALLASTPAPVSGQVVIPIPGAVSCTASLVTSFAPCLNFVINSTASPTADCCRSLGALMKASTGCACLILTGSVPLGVPINRTLAVTLPRACNNASLPLECRRGTSAQSPAPGPVADAPAPSLPLAPSSLAPAVTPAAATPEPEAPAPEAQAPALPPVVPAAPAPVSQGQTRPTVVPSAAWRARAVCAGGPAVGLLLAVVAGGALL